MSTWYGMVKYNGMIEIRPDKPYDVLLDEHVYTLKATTEAEALSEMARIADSLYPEKRGIKK